LVFYELKARDHLLLNLKPLSAIQVKKQLT